MLLSGREEVSSQYACTNHPSVGAPEPGGHTAPSQRVGLPVRFERQGTATENRIHKAHHTRQAEDSNAEVLLATGNSKSWNDVLYWSSALMRSGI